jgi:hypothetical protein
MIVCAVSSSSSIDEDFWKEWTKFVIDETGSARKISEEVEKALRLYMKNK